MDIIIMVMAGAIFIASLLSFIKEDDHLIETYKQYFNNIGTVEKHMIYHRITYAVIVSSMIFVILLFSGIVIEVPSCFEWGGS